MSTDDEPTARRLTWGVLALEFAGLGLAFQVLLGGSLSRGLASLVVHAPGMWVLAGIITLISADHVHRVVKHLLAK